ncbi:MAG: diguanylate cyclase [Burkholderiales bacterium]|jgi:diguanylate cyclase (GGDEF)-like protein|nr:diguanylate cyclase [Burkholderiales bacterium]
MQINLRRIFDSIFTRLLLLAFCLVVLGFSIRYYMLTGFLQKDLSAVVEGQQLALASYVARDIDDKMVQRRALLERLAANLPPDLLKQPEQLGAWLKEHFEYQPLFSAGLFVTDARGIALADYPVLPGRVNTDYADRDYIHAGLAGNSFVGRPVIGRAAKEPVLPVAAPVKNGKGEVLGVLVGVTALAAQGFLNSLLKTRIGETTGGFLLISPRDQLFVASSQPEMVLKPTPPPGVNVLHDRAMAGYRGTGVTVNAKGIEEVAAIVTVPSTGWFVVARVPSSEAFATVARTKDFLVKGSLLTLLIFAVLTPLGLYFVFRHLSRAAAHADRMTLGELPLEPMPVYRNDEVGHLISAFNRLLAKLNQNQAELARMAHHDTLTGLPNRALLSDRLHQLLAQARRKKGTVGLLFMDLDGFKDINDTLGHEAGDEVLRQVAGRLAEIVREADTLARVGGDEFVLLLNDLGDNAAEGAGIVALKCIETLKTPFPVSGTHCAVGVSIGIALGNGESAADALLLAADHAMYEAKKAGRGRYVMRGL